jgi:hypothetical protein
MARRWNLRPSVIASVAALITALLLVVLAAGASSAKAASSLQISAAPALFPAFNPAITDYVTRCTAGTPVRVSVSGPANVKVSVDGQQTNKRDFIASVSLSAGRGFRITSTAPGNKTATYYVRCLPADFPQWTFQRSGQPQAEWYAVAPIGTSYGALFDQNGVPIWWIPTTGGGAGDFKLLPNGNVAWERLDEAGVEERRLDGSLARTVNAVGATADIHEILLLANGNYLMATRRQLPGMTACGSNLEIADNGLQEIAPNGSLVWSWWASDHIPLSEVPAAWCGVGLEAGDVYHINSAEPSGDGFVISFRQLDAVYRINRADGSIAWKLGGVTRPESLQVLNDPAFTSGGGFAGQHDARVLADGTLTLHDNAYHPSGFASPRAVRYSLDPNARTATLVESKSDPSGIPRALCCGSARKLPGGDWVMSWGFNPLVTELSSTGARVLGITFQSGIFAYRAQPILPGTVSRTALRQGMDTQFPR